MENWEQSEALFQEGTANSIGEGISLLKSDPLLPVTMGDFWKLTDKISDYWQGSDHLVIQHLWEGGEIRYCGKEFPNGMAFIPKSATKINLELDEAVSLPAEIQLWSALESFELYAPNLIEFPEYFCDFQHLKRLNLSIESCENLPLGILTQGSITSFILLRSKLSTLSISEVIAAKLEELWLCESENLKIEECIGHLNFPKLEKLCLWSVFMQTIPGTIWRSAALRSVLIRRTEIGAFSPPVGGCGWLEILELDDNTNLTHLGPEIGNLKSLREICINTVESVPAELFSQTRLSKFETINGKLKQLPNAFQADMQLEVLNLFGSQIETLPDSVSELKSLQLLILAKTPLAKSLGKDAAAFLREYLQEALPGCAISA